jgi:hypothetical protein
LVGYHAVVAGSQTGIGSVDRRARGSVLTPLPAYGGDEKLANNYSYGVGPVSLSYNRSFN